MPTTFEKLPDPNPVEPSLTEKINIFQRPEAAKVKPHTHEAVELVYMYEGEGIVNIHKKTLS
ncbi:MAG: hypothetical protein ACOWWO_16435 [Peptococcaceae bacterium]